jgi:hypothetical protein
MLEKGGSNQESRTADPRVWTARSSKGATFATTAGKQMRHTAFNSMQLLWRSRRRWWKAAISWI